MFCYHTFRFPHCVWNLIIHLFCTLWNINYFTSGFVENSDHSFRNVENLSCTFHIVENITRCFPHSENYQGFFHIIILIFLLWQSTLLIFWSISSTCHQLSLQICGHFRDLENFFPTHARMQYPISALYGWDLAKITVL